MASQEWRSLTIPSMPMISPVIWKPVTWSRPSAVVTQVLKNPERTAYREVNLSPVLNSAVPRLMRRRVEITLSSLSISSGLSPMGRHNSRRLQLEQATLMLWMSINFPELGRSLTHGRRQQQGDVGSAGRQEGENPKGGRPP